MKALSIRQPWAWLIVHGPKRWENRAWAKRHPGWRPMRYEWARHLGAQCADARIPFFMKQLGGHPNKHGDLNDMPADLRVRQFPTL